MVRKYAKIKENMINDEYYDKKVLPRHSYLFNFFSKKKIHIVKNSHKIY